MNTELQIVEFIKNASPYNRGEKAGFSPERAANLKARGLVKFVNTIAVKKEDKGDDNDKQPKREVGRGRRNLSGKDQSGPDYETK